MDVITPSGCSTAEGVVTHRIARLIPSSSRSPAFEVKPNRPVKRPPSIASIAQPTTIPSIKTDTRISRTSRKGIARSGADVATLYKDPASSFRLACPHRRAGAGAGAGSA